jgi:hypothetical protein
MYRTGLRDMHELAPQLIREDSTRRTIPRHDTRKLALAACDNRSGIPQCAPGFATGFGINRSGIHQIAPRWANKRRAKRPGIHQIAPGITPAGVANRPGIRQIAPSLKCVPTVVGVRVVCWRATVVRNVGMSDAPVHTRGASIGRVLPSLATAGVGRQWSCLVPSHHSVAGSGGGRYGQMRTTRS